MGGYKASDMGIALKGKRKNPLVDDIVDEETLAEYIGCHPTTIRYYTRKMGLPFIPLGRDRYYSVKSTYDWLISRQKSNSVLIIEPGNGNGSKKTPLTKRSKGLVKVEI